MYSERDLSSDLQLHTTSETMFVFIKISSHQKEDKLKNYIVQNVKYKNSMQSHIHIFSVGSLKKKEEENDTYLHGVCVIY